MNLMTLIPFTEHWATIYKPMQHDRKSNKRFYCVESIANIANLSKELPRIHSPFVCIETNIGGDIGNKFLEPEYNVYFFVQAGQKVQDNDIADSSAKDEAMRHAIAYLNYIRHEKDIHEDDRESQLLGIDTDQVHFETFGPILNRWFCVGIALSDLSKYSHCMSKDDYIEEGTWKKE